MVETLPAAKLPEGAEEPYSKLLFASVPKLDAGWLDSVTSDPELRKALLAR